MNKLFTFGLILLFSWSTPTLAKKPIKSTDKDVSATTVASEISTEEAEFASNVDVEYDGFKKEIQYKSSPIRILKPGDSYWHNIFLRAYKKDKGTTSNFQIYVDTNYHASRYIDYEQAYDDKGTRLPLSKIDHEVISCDEDGRCLFNEVFAITVSKGYLTSRGKSDDVEFKIEGRNDYLQFGIQGAYIRGFLTAIKSKKPVD